MSSDNIKSDSSIVKIKKNVLKNIIMENKKNNIEKKHFQYLFDILKTKINHEKYNKNINITDDEIKNYMHTDLKIQEDEKKSELQKGEELKLELQNGGKNIERSETSLVSSIFKKKSEIKNKSTTSKYSQSTSYSESVKKIRNTVNKTKILQGGNTTINSSSSESENETDSEDEETEESSSDNTSESSDISSINNSNNETLNTIQNTVDGGNMTNTEGEINKAYKKLSKEMKYYKNKKDKVKKRDVERINFILNGLHMLDKYKK
jgi:hypothetical protein